MEFSSQDLHHMLLDRPMRRVPQDTALEIWSNLCEALQHIHSCGTMHRDVHGGNVLVQHSAPGQSTLTIEDIQSVKLADFGKATKVIGDKPVPLYTAETCPLRAMAPEVLFRHGTHWAPTGKRSATSQGLVSTCLQHYVLVSAPKDCTYDGRIDNWASGILFIHMLFGGPYNETGPKNFDAKEMIQTFGKVPRDLVNACSWSVPSEWIEDSGNASKSGYVPPRRFSMGAATSLMEQERFDNALACLRYNPRLRTSRVLPRVRPSTPPIARLELELKAAFGRLASMTGQK